MLARDKSKNLCFIAYNNNIKVTISPRFEQTKSKVNSHGFVWFYDVEIENHTDFIIEMLSHHLQIFYNNGLKENITVSSVISQRPIIEPNMSLYYTERLCTPCDSGLAIGVYNAIDLSNTKEFTIKIPAFSFDITDDHHIAN